VRQVVNILPWSVIPGRSNFCHCTRPGGCEIVKFRAGYWGTFAGCPLGLVLYRLRSAFP
jgi:hypothetical protein